MSDSPPSCNPSLILLNYIITMVQLFDYIRLLGRILPSRYTRQSGIKGRPSRQAPPGPHPPGPYGCLLDISHSIVFYYYITKIIQAIFNKLSLTNVHSFFSSSTGLSFSFSECLWLTWGGLFISITFIKCFHKQFVNLYESLLSKL